MRTILVAGVLFLCAIAPSPSRAAGDDPTAIAILDRMADNIGALHACSFRVEASHDQFDARAGTLVKHHDYHQVSLVGPDKMLVHSTGDGGRRGFWYDGERATYYSYDENNYGSVAAPPTIIATIDSLHRVYEIDFPAADFIYPSFVDDLIAQSDLIVYCGRAQIAGQDCYHVVAKGPQQDVQIWVSSDATTLPVRYVFRNKSKDGVTEFAGTFVGWQLNPELPNTMFRFAPPPGSRSVRMLPGDSKKTGGRR